MNVGTAHYTLVAGAPVAVLPPPVMHHATVVGAFVAVTRRRQVSKVTLKRGTMGVHYEYLFFAAPFQTDWRYDTSLYSAAVIH